MSHNKCICVECEKERDALNIVRLIDERMGEGWTRDLAHVLFLNASSKPTANPSSEQK